MIKFQQSQALTSHFESFWSIVSNGKLVCSLIQFFELIFRWLPGKCDIWFQSHQIFHLLVVAAAFVHYNGISEMALHRLTKLGPMCPTYVVSATPTGL